MTLTKGALTLALLVAASFAVKADEMQPPTVGGFSTECQPIRAFQRGESVPAGKDVLVAFCFGYIVGAAENGQESTTYCAPYGASTQQRALIFLKWADENPELHDLPRSLGLALALSKAFPCPSNRAK